MLPTHSINGGYPRSCLVHFSRKLQRVRAHVLASCAQLMCSHPPACRYNCIVYEVQYSFCLVLSTPITNDNYEETYAELTYQGCALFRRTGTGVKTTEFLDRDTRQGWAGPGPHIDIVLVSGTRPWSRHSNKCVQPRKFAGAPDADQCLQGAFFLELSPKISLLSSAVGIFL